MYVSMQITYFKKYGILLIYYIDRDDVDFSLNKILNDFLGFYRYKITIS